MTIGERMRDRRKQLGFSAEYIAENLGCSPATIYRYENGYIEKMPIDSIAPIASILGVTPAFLMGWEDINAEPAGGRGGDEVTRKLLDFVATATDDELRQLIDYIAFIKSRRSGQ